jgi:hypothetical protein
MELPTTNQIIDDPPCLVRVAQRIENQSGEQYLRNVEEIVGKIFEVYFQMREAREIECQSFMDENRLALFYGSKNYNPRKFHPLENLLEFLVINEKNYESGARGMRLEVPKCKVHNLSQERYSWIFNKLAGEEDEQAYRVNVYLPFPMLPRTAAKCHTTDRLKWVMTHSPSVKFGELSYTDDVNLDINSAPNPGKTYTLLYMQLTNILKRSRIWTLPIASLGSIHFMSEAETESVTFVQPDWKSGSTREFKIDDIHRHYEKLMDVT